MDPVTALEKFGYPVGTAVVMGWVCWKLLQKIEGIFDQQRLAWEKREAALESDLKAERLLNHGELVRMVIGYEKIAEDALERLGKP